MSAGFIVQMKKNGRWLRTVWTIPDGDPRLDAKNLKRLSCTPVSREEAMTGRALAEERYPDNYYRVHEVAK
jgi:hypothetical protein